jgi:hypothetical protein
MQERGAYPVIRLEKISNIALILICVVVLATMGRNWYRSYMASQSDIHKGQLIKLPGQALSGGPTLVLALSVGCEFCQDSVSFYRKLAAFRNSSSGLRMVAVFPQSEVEATTYLKTQGITADAVISLPLEQIAVRGTPTLFLLDGQSKVQELWLGKLDNTQEIELMASLKKVCPGCSLAATASP